jgi:hypothetical protein
LASISESFWETDLLIQGITTNIKRHETNYWIPRETELSLRQPGIFGKNNFAGFFLQQGKIIATDYGCGYVGCLYGVPNVGR